ncbi:MAG: RagB/SusD family nutrient uptake outer membrane protein [Firmicutes bacterium]|nr:RagB/SusD family nutrient uptake outer membrane protein [Bacillota bacterium]MCM1401694.1 RagB/SusD family nutrient uptake outer membrane protein [Bacteroides sp.]MCM1477502.1 RagB/SusD family nutrient uptake outer membrane protein [Bacteroides sp.]
MMKKVLSTIFLAGTLMLSSCDMDLSQPGTITLGKSMQTADDVLGFRNNVYSQLRALCSGSYVTNVELQSDFFIGLRGNGGRGSTMSQGTFTPSTSAISSCYGGSYGAIGTINYILEKGTDLLGSGTLSADEEAEVNRYLAECRFMRAYIYYWLFDHYCQAYTPDKANTPALGLQLMTTFNPSATPAEYPGRSTMAETIKLINDDLTAAYDGLLEWEGIDASQCAPNAYYLSSYAVAALQARVALLTQDYATAISKAQHVIDSSIFALCQGQDYIAMWSNDEGSELIFVPFVDANEAGSVGSFFDAYNYVSNFPTRVDYVPTYEVVSSYSSKDVRGNAFFAGLEMTVDAQPTAAYIFNKFPGNVALIQGRTNNYKNKPKPFRLSELYLILAEAAQSSTQEPVANQALNTLRKARISGYKDATYSGTLLRDEIRRERAKELIGEGFRISDLRRWGLGFKRDNSYENLGSGYTPLPNLFISSDVSVVYQANDYRYTWPIPADEFDVNKQITGQQNPGYDN